ncbi:MAG TPA: hypothetical protein VNX21_07095, partial [Candidatus Thermoplasmatota archaeon]|nr:hypothetical protein [Candidatus Thermoplasmatota archaeon]
MSAGAGAGLPPKAARYVMLVLAAGGLLAAGSLVAVVLQPRPSLAALAMGAAAGAAAFVLQRRGFVFHWGGQRTTSTLDEPTLFFALLVLPPPHAILCVLGGIVVAQVVARRKPIKGAYNASAYALSAGVGALAYRAVLGAGADPLAAGAAAVVGYAVTSNVLISFLFARLESASALRILRERFARTLLVNAMFGYALVVALVALWRLHPAAPLALAPLV